VRVLHRYPGAELDLGAQRLVEGRVARQAGCVGHLEVEGDEVDQRSGRARRSTALASAHHVPMARHGTAFIGHLAGAHNLPWRDISARDQRNRRRP